MSTITFCGVTTLLDGKKQNEEMKLCGFTTLLDGFLGDKQLQLQNIDRNGTQKHATFVHEVQRSTNALHFEQVQFLIKPGSTDPQQQENVVITLLWSIMAITGK